MKEGRGSSCEFGAAVGSRSAGGVEVALFADAGFGALIAVAVDRGGAGVDGGFHERPSQVAASLLGERASAVGLAGLVDARTLWRR